MRCRKRKSSRRSSRFRGGHHLLAFARRSSRADLLRSAGAVIVGGIAAVIASELLLALLFVLPIARPEGVFLLPFAFGLGACAGGAVAAVIAPLDAWLCGLLSSSIPMTALVLTLLMAAGEGDDVTHPGRFTAGMVVLISLMPALSCLGALTFVRAKKKREARGR